MSARYNEFLDAHRPTTAARTEDAYEGTYGTVKPEDVDIAESKEEFGNDDVSALTTHEARYERASENPTGFSTVTSSQGKVRPVKLNESVPDVVPQDMKDEEGGGEAEGGIGQEIAKGNLSVRGHQKAAVKGYNQVDESLGSIHHAHLYQDWAHSRGISKDSWSDLVAKHGSEAEAKKNSLWSGRINTTKDTKDDFGRVTGTETVSKAIMSRFDKAQWQRTSEGQRATSDYRKALGTTEPSDHATAQSNYAQRRRVTSLALTGNQGLDTGNKYRADVQGVIDRMASGKVSKGTPLRPSVIEPEDIPGYSGSMAQRHAIGAEDPRGDVYVGRHESPAAARFLGASDDFAHHHALTQAVTDLVTKSKGGNEGAAVQGIKNASGQLSFNEPTTRVTIASPAEHHANLALQYLAASAKAQSLGMKDIAVNNFANATAHAKHLQTYVGKPAAAPAAGGGLAALLAGGSAPTSHTDIGNHLERYKAAMGVK